MTLCSDTGGLQSAHFATKYHRVEMPLGKKNPWLVDKNAVELYIPTSYSKIMFVSNIFSQKVYHFDLLKQRRNIL